MQVGIQFGQVLSRFSDHEKHGFTCSGDLSSVFMRRNWLKAKDAKVCCPDAAEREEVVM